MKSITCIIIDDEPKAIELLTDSLNAYYKNISILGSYMQWRQALEALHDTGADLVFLDISINDKNSMDLLKVVPNLKSELIFVTAYPDYALSAFKFSTSGYVMKPIEDAELIIAVDKAIERISNKKASVKELVPKGDIIGIPNNKGIEYLHINDIVYLEALNTYTKIVTTSVEIVSSYNMKKINDSITSTGFLQVHRGFVINILHVRRYEYSGAAVMVNDISIPVSRNYKDEFLNMFNRIKAKP